NSYNGFHSAPSELHYLHNNRITALETAIKIHICTETGRIENVSIGDYWSRSGLPGAPNASVVADYTKTNSVGFEMHRSDWEYISHLSVTNYKTGLWVGREAYRIDGQNVLAGYTPNAQFYGLVLQNCGTGLYIDGINGFGLLISDSKLGGDNAVWFDTEFDTVVQFNGVDFYGQLVSESKGGISSFENCDFSGYADAHAIQVNGNMNLLLSQSEFDTADSHIHNAKGSTVKAVNSGYNGVLNISGNTDKVSQIKNDAYIAEPLPYGIPTVPAILPKAGGDNVLKAELPRVTGINNDSPTVDVSELLQNALDAMRDAGGGIVYLPGGRYLVNSPITVPSGVELRGTWDVQHHTEGGGAAIFTDYGKSTDGDGESLIQLKEGAGLRGLSIVQTNITATSSFDDNAPFLIQGQGKRVFIVNVTVPVGYRGIDLMTYHTDGHYVDYFSGVLLKAGIWVGGGDTDGFIRNTQFNPHYALRFPAGKQGYPTVSNASSALYNYIQSNCSALLLSDVNNQTVFNSFIFGSVYGVHFKKDELTEKYPGKITLLGYGTDGCTYTMYVEDGDADTQITAVNSQLVNTSLASQSERTYIKMGANTSADIHSKATLMLCNSSFWGSTTTGPIVNAGTLIFRQANFHQMNGNNPGLNVNGGSLRTLNSYFAYDRDVGYAPNPLYLSLTGTGTAEFTNNYYRANSEIGALQYERYSPNDDIKKVYGSDIADSVTCFELIGMPKGTHTFYDDTPLLIGLKNTGDTVLNQVQVTVNDDNFVLSGTVDAAVVEPEEIMNFTVAPKPGLKLGSYSATVSLAINDIPAASLKVSYTQTVCPHLTVKTGDCTICDDCGDVIDGFSHDFSGWLINTTHHWKICTNCLTVAQLSAHTEVNQSAVDSDCTLDLVCLCDFVMTSGAAAHSPKSTDCTSCNHCTATLGTHSPKSTDCTACNHCTATLGTHNPKATDCTACNHCTATLGTHNPKATDCTACNHCTATLGTHNPKATDCTACNHCTATLGTHSPKSTDCTACNHCTAILGTHAPKATDCTECKNCTAAELAKVCSYEAPCELHAAVYIKAVVTEGNGYIELHNPTNRSISTKGLFLTNNGDSFKWQMPTTKIYKASTIRIYVKSNHINTAVKGLQTNFDLSVGETLYLTDATGEILFEVDLTV
ncbi:MAG: hypothetical protein FWF94_07335, partial [Oscillospiraceae bacterium]|nr:hypothetical protein [Oscillospiraceae bacterium]